MAVTHKFVSAIADSGDTTIVQPSNWNDTHEGALEKASGTVDFGTTEGNGDASVSVAATWVTGASIIVVSPGAATADHDVEDALLEQITASVTALSAGVGFTITAHAPNGTWGQYTFNAVGL
jgi:hypothetical protein